MNTNKTLEDINQMSSSELQTYLILGHQRLPPEEKSHSYYLSRSIAYHKHLTSKIARHKKRLLSSAAINSTPKKRRHSSTTSTIENTPSSRTHRTKIPHRRTPTTQSPNAYAAIRKKRERMRRSTMDPSTTKKNTDKPLKKYRLETLPKSMTILQLRTWLQDHNIQYEVSGRRKQYYIDLVSDHIIDDQFSPPPTKRQKATKDLPLPSNLQLSPLTPEYLQRKKQENNDNYDFNRTSSEQMRREIINLLNCSGTDDDDDDGKCTDVPPPPYFPPPVNISPMKKEKSRRKSYEPQSEVKERFVKKKRRRSAYSFLDTNERQFSVYQQIQERNISSLVANVSDDVPSVQPMIPTVQPMVSVKPVPMHSTDEQPYISNTVLLLTFIIAVVACVCKWLEMDDIVILIVVGACVIVFTVVWYEGKWRRETKYELEVLRNGLYDVLRSRVNVSEGYFVAVPVVEIKQYLKPSSEKIWKHFVHGIWKDGNVQKSVRMIDGLQKHCWSFCSVGGTPDGRDVGQQLGQFNGGRMDGQGNVGQGQQRSGNQSYWV